MLVYCSPHFPLPITFSLMSVVSDTDSCSQSSFSFQNYASADYLGMCDFLLDWDFDPCLSSLDVEFIWSHIKSAIITAIEKFVPTATVSHCHSHQPRWFDGSIRHNLNRLKMLRRGCLSNPTSSRLDQLSQLESTVSDDIATAKSTHVSHLIQKSVIDKSPSCLYSHIRSKTKQSHIPPRLFMGSSSAATAKEKADLFNEYFFSVYSTCSSYPTPMSLPSSSVSLSDIDISPFEVLQALSKLNLSKAMGADGIGPQILKSCSVALYEPLCHLFCVSLQSASIPSDWRLHRITPVFKSGDKSLVSNYRPVSLLSCTSKVLEWLVYDKIVPFVAPSISCSQFGFMQGRSTLQQLLIFLSEIFKNIDGGLQTDAIYLDLRKAFDSVPHDKLLVKLHSIGIDGTL